MLWCNNLFRFFIVYMSSNNPVFFLPMIYFAVLISEYLISSHGDPSHTRLSVNLEYTDVQPLILVFSKYLQHWIPDIRLFLLRKLLINSECSFPASLFNAQSYYATLNLEYLTSPCGNTSKDFRFLLLLAFHLQISFRCWH